MTQNNGYVKITEIAKLVRSDLKEAFPNTTFSVRSDTYTGGRSIDVFYKNGPSERKVDGILEFRKPDDYTYITPSRTFSPEIEAEAVKMGLNSNDFEAHSKAAKWLLCGDFN